MNSIKKIIKKIPGWAFSLALFGTLYATGLHTEALGQVQRLILATGLNRADIPEKVAAAAATQHTQPPYPGADFKMVNLEGELVPFEHLKGKVIFLNIWASWCPPCVAEMPGIQSLYEKVGSDKIAFVMLSVDQEGMEKVTKFIRRKEYTFPVYLPATALPNEFRSQAIPTTYIISPEGKIVMQHNGMADYDTAEMKEYLQSLAQ